jgi:serine/threonine protein kinase/tetratricopeptide (TPR) repeat protein
MTVELASRYELGRRLGEGGMGTVYEALDRHLGRAVAIKMIRGDVIDAATRERFTREARAAAAISHPNVCHLHEVGEDAGRPFLVMELLEGEPLSDRLLRGPLALGPALEIFLPILSALTALHTRGLVHRDLKPSNVFLTPHGVKLLDFGLARQISRDAADTMSAITLPGTLSGTPRYMAPEQITGDAVDARADIFAAGVLLYELVTGNLPYDGRTTVEVLSAVLRTGPAPTGRPELASLEPLLQRALERRPDDRFLTADAMAAALRPLVVAAAGGHLAQTASAPPSPAARIVVLPFRLLRADEEVAFLEGGLPEAITSSLASVPSLVVRSNVAAIKFGPSADLALVASELDVDHVLTGTLMRSGSQLRVTSQLVEMPGGRVRWSQTLQRPLGDLFELQDTIVQHIVESLPLDARAADGRPRDAPASPHAYELYLRANQQALDYRALETARDLYEQCVAEDPRFAPAWAQLGRVLRITGKYFQADYRPSYAAAEAAFQRAFALSPDLALVHHLYVYLEVETGRATQALIRIAARLHREPHQPELYAALCQAARYCGLLDVSLAAHHRAHALDPQVRTSVANTYLTLLDYPKLLESTRGVLGSLAGLALHELGVGVDEATRAIDSELTGFAADSSSGLFRSALVASVSGDRDEVLRACQGLIAANEHFPDGEGIYLVARMLARAGWRELAIHGLEMTVDAGFFPAPTFERDPWLDDLRELPEFQQLSARARERCLAADAAFQTAGGYRLLGMRPRSSVA